MLRYSSQPWSRSNLRPDASLLICAVCSRHAFVLGTGALAALCRAAFWNAQELKMSELLAALRTQYSDNDRTWPCVPVSVEACIEDDLDQDRFSKLKRKSRDQLLEDIFLQTP